MYSTNRVDIVFLPATFTQWPLIQKKQCGTMFGFTFFSQSQLFQLIDCYENSQYLSHIIVEHQSFVRSNTTLHTLSLGTANASFVFWFPFSLWCQREGWLGMNRSPGPNWLRVQIEMCDVIQLANDASVQCFLQVTILWMNISFLADVTNVILGRWDKHKVLNNNNVGGVYLFTFNEGKQFSQIYY